VTTPLRERVPFVMAAFAVMVAAVLVAPLIGSSAISFRRAFDAGVPFAENVDAQIFFIARLPRALAAAIVGASLAAAGVVFQALLRNPLATPYTLGVSTGASLGAMLAITFGWSLPGLISRVLPAVSAAALLGAMGSVLIVYWLARARHSGLSTTVLLLAGVTLNSFFSALILFVQYIGNFSDVYRAMRWLMGNLDVSSYGQIGGALPFIALASAIFVWLARPLNLMAAGVDAAESRGLDVQRTQRLAFFSASIITGAAVSIGGPIGFVGIIVPHLVRLVAGADHRIVLPASAFVGGAFLVACDVVARTILAPVELPVGIVTATIGGPFFLWMLIKRGRV
jgi:iron complex transport system permease protein